MKKPVVIIESPYAGDIKRNELYARRCMKDSILRGEAPFVSHLLYTQVLNDTISKERTLGMESGFAFIEKSDYSVCYEDYGISRGMEEGIRRAKEVGHEVLHRRIGENIDNFCEECKGKCCVGLIEVFPSDIMYANESLTTEVPKDFFKPISYNRIMRTNSQNQCVAMVDGKCSIYENRPKICRDFKVQSECCNGFRSGKITIHDCRVCKLE